MPLSQDKQRWYDMCRRCTEPKRRLYKYYGARGIKVCEEWLNSYEAYKKYIDALPGRTEGSTIDRINNDGHYEPGNVRWADRSTQMRNRRKWGKGYTKRKSGSFQVCVQVNGKVKTFGTFATEEEAIAKVKEVRDGLA